MPKLGTTGSNLTPKCHLSLFSPTEKSVLHSSVLPFQVPRLVYQTPCLCRPKGTRWLFSTPQFYNIWQIPVFLKIKSTLLEYHSRSATIFYLQFHLPSSPHYTPGSLQDALAGVLYIDLPCEFDFFFVSPWHILYPPARGELPIHSLMNCSNV